METDIENFATFHRLPRIMLSKHGQNLNTRIGRRDTRTIAWLYTIVLQYKMTQSGDKAVLFVS
jgi:hypothetical protein